MAINKEFRVKHGLISEDDVIVNGSVTATSFIGDGSQLTGISSFSGDYNDLTNKPTLFSGNYNELSGLPNLVKQLLNGLLIILLQMVHAILLVTMNKNSLVSKFNNDMKKSGHLEHISMLRAKALEFETSLEEFEIIIAECEKNFIAPSEEEIQAEITLHLGNEARNYLASTDYKMTVDYFASLDKVTQDELIAERQKAREFIRANS